MEKRHAQMYRRLLEEISEYSEMILGAMQRGAGDLPQWASSIIAESKTHLSDVTHFLRGQERRGIRYGSHGHGAAYMATANLRHIHEYAKESLSLLERGAGIFPAWVENKISVCAKYMDLIGHWMKNESAEGRVYGSRPPAAFYQGLVDGVTGRHRNPYSPNDARRPLYEEGYRSELAPGDGRRTASSSAIAEAPSSKRKSSRPKRRKKSSRRRGRVAGKRFGVPGFVAGQPGWAGNAGVAQMPHPSRVIRAPAGVTTGMGRQTYGSLGYASMGDGSMDMAVRSPRRYAGGFRTKKRR